MNVNSFEFGARYQVVFDCTVSWAENLRVVAWVALLTQNTSLQWWLVMQCIKMLSTLRVYARAGSPIDLDVLEISSLLEQADPTKFVWRALFQPVMVTPSFSLGGDDCRRA